MVVQIDKTVVQIDIPKNDFEGIDNMSREEICQYVQKKIMEGMNQFLGRQLDKNNIYNIQAVLTNQLRDLYQIGKISFVPNILVEQSEADPTMVFLLWKKDNGMVTGLDEFFKEQFLEGPIF